MKIPEVNAVYFRSHDVHQIPGSNDHIFSFSKWSDTIEALEKEMPDKGTAITTDYATIEDWSELPDNPEIIKDRIRKVLDISRRTDTVIHLSTPTPLNKRGTKWYNSAYAIHRGDIKSAAHKTSLFKIEQQVNKMIKPATDTRQAYMGNVALICSELHAYGPSDILRAQNPRQVFAHTNWAVPPSPSEEHRRALEETGYDKHYGGFMEMFIGGMVLKRMPTVQRVIVSDRGGWPMYDGRLLEPFNGYFERKPSET